MSIVWRASDHVWQDGPGGVRIWVVPGRQVVDAPEPAEEPAPREAKPRKSEIKAFICDCLRGNRRMTIRQIAEASGGRFRECAIYWLLRYHKKIFCKVGWEGQSVLWALRDEVMANADCRLNSR